MALALTPYQHVYVDFEFVGDLQKDISDCHIWNIGAVKPDGSTFEIILNVPTNKKTHSGCVHVTDAFLAKYNAVPFDIGFRQFVNWMGQQAVLISHNNFKSDKLVLELECRRHQVQLPAWYFYDSLLFLRSNLTLPSYRLADVYLHVMKKPFKETHNALPDALGLREILQKIPPKGLYMYPRYVTPLQNVRWVGAACEHEFVNSGIRSVEQLIMHFVQRVQVAGDSVSLMKQFLTAFNLPVQDLSAISTEIVQNWLPTIYGGKSYKSYF